MRTTGKRVADCNRKDSVDLLHSGTPLDFLADEHFRERSICSLIDMLAEAPTPDRQAMTTVLDFLGAGLPAHVHSDVVQFFPLLRKRCHAEDEIDRVIDAVITEHDFTMWGLPQLASTLQRHLRDGSACTGTERELLHEFAAHIRRHVVVENAILIPIAKVRLSKADLSVLRKSLLESRKPLSIGGYDAG